jgi:hypothetical protein
MSKPINSPLPWQLYNKDNKALQIISAEGVIVATVELAEPSLMEYDEWEANAALLLASVNAYSALVEAAHAVDDWFAGRTYNGPAEREAMAALARKAIALAESAEVKS